MEVVSLVENAGTFYILQACMQGNFIENLEKLVRVPVVTFPPLNIFQFDTDTITLLVCRLFCE